MVPGSSKKKRDTEKSPVSELSDDLLVEIMSLLPYKSTCCCKCVSRRWRDLVSHPDHRKKLPQSTLAGFFFETYDITSREVSRSRRYQSVSGNWCPRINASLSFLPKCERLDIMDSCNGLLLCRCWKSTDGKMMDYVVCNPATEKWVVVPATNWSSKLWAIRLGFDPAVSSHFHVFEFVPAFVLDEADRRRYIKVVGVYSSKAGVWTHESTGNHLVDICIFSSSVFLGGVMYLSSYNDLVIAVDMEGKCKVIRTPALRDGCGAYDISLSQGRLYLAKHGDSEVSIWALDDSSTGNWTLKNKVSHLQLFEKEYSSMHDYDVIIHPEDNAIIVLCAQLHIGGQSLTKVLSYNVESREQHFMTDLGWYCRIPYLSYVPLFSESLADAQ
ncbi:hypothetical protein VPH35_055161 [Triticum aestivum]|uniref:F-box domain-containing protein n=1 Tax=Triticum aestivum TaxID=4565 RepID=A0A077RY61_WHEAT|nr:unnamed protein product [Triticum aestivum]CDM82276.1 unnamed protein product [Triticum aestivum]